MIKFSIPFSQIAISLALSMPLFAHAGLFEDDEARKAILDLRSKVDAMRSELGSQLENKSDKSSTVDLLNQNEQLRSEIARLRGQLEVMSNELANAQKRQKDFYIDLDARVRKFEPMKVNLDGHEVSVEPAEQKAYESALETFKSGEFKPAANAFQDFLRRYPNSAYAGHAFNNLGNAYYALRDCKSAIAAHQSVVKNYADSGKAPDSLLSIASCHSELKEKSAAKKTLEALISQFPDSAAAQTARERLGAK